MPKPLHSGIVRAGVHGGAQLRGGGQGGRDVLAEFQMGDVGAPHGQRGAQQQPLQLRF